MMAATRVGNAGEIWIALAAVLLCSKKTRPVSIAIIVSLFADLFISNGLLKFLFARPRPCAIETGVSMLQACPPSFSFPSGHTAVSFTVLGVLLASREFKIALAALPVALLIAFSRLWLFAHFPTDVLGGCCRGTRDWIWHLASPSPDPRIQAALEPIEQRGSTDTSLNKTAPRKITNGTLFLSEARDNQLFFKSTANNNFAIPHHLTPLGKNIRKFKIVIKKQCICRCSIGHPTLRR